MSARALIASQQHTAKAYSIVGTYEPGMTFVRHAALLSKSASNAPAAAHLTITGGAEVIVCHMCPPLYIPGTMHTGGQPTTTANVLGYVDDLNEEEIEGIDTWIGDVATRVPTVSEVGGILGAFQVRWLNWYVLCPPVKQAERDTVNGRVVYNRYSCVGFVVDCYEGGANIRLLSWDSTDFPKIKIEELVAVYSERDILHPVTRTDIGVSDSGEWPIALPGYVFHALRRPADEIRRSPYCPRSKAEVYFPSRSNDPLTAAEHSEAERVAYFHALDRGGGVLPPYDEARAVEDFCRAAGTLLQFRNT